MLFRIVLALFALVGATASAQTISGTIAGTIGGQGSTYLTTDTLGIFGPAGANLVGDAFSLSYSYNTSDFSGGPISCGTNCTYYYTPYNATPATSAFISVTINGVTQTYSPSIYAEVQFQNSFSGYNGNYFAESIDVAAGVRGTTFSIGSLNGVAFGKPVSAGGSLQNSLGFYASSGFEELDYVLCFKSNDVFPYRDSPYSLDKWPEVMKATFEPTGPDGLPMGLAAAAAACRFTSFDWQQTVVDPDVDAINPQTGQLFVASTLAPETPLMNPFLDPPPGGYTYQESDPNLQDIPNAGAYPFYWAPEEPSAWVSTPSEPYYPLSLLANESFDGCPASPLCITLNFEDWPVGSLLQPGQYKKFTTSLVGVVGDYPGATASFPLYTWQWTSTFNGTKGGVSVNVENNTSPADPGSGTGGVTITSINGVQLPPVVPQSQVATTASGLAYSRVSETFKGTVTMTNVGTSAISGPLQILLMGMPFNVMLVNATGNLSGTPYLTVAAEAGLDPGQSITVSVQFNNPSNATISFTPVIYSGSIN